MLLLAHRVDGSGLEAYLTKCPPRVEHVAQIGKPIAMTGQLHQTSWIVGIQRGVIHLRQGWRSGDL